MNRPWNDRTPFRSALSPILTGHRFAGFETHVSEVVR